LRRVRKGAPGGRVGVLWCCRRQSGSPAVLRIRVGVRVAGGEWCPKKAAEGAFVGRCVVTLVGSAPTDAPVLAVLVAEGVAAFDAVYIGRSSMKERRVCLVGHRRVPPRLRMVGHRQSRATR
jgi:hypothetical protein